MKRYLITVVMVVGNIWKKLIKVYFGRDLKVIIDLYVEDKRCKYL